MGLGNALRRVWGSPSSAASQDQSAAPRDSSSRRRHSRNNRASASSDRRRRRSSKASAPPPRRAEGGEPHGRGPSSTHAPPLTPLQAQERAVVASYRANLYSLTERIVVLWTQFDDEPDEYGVTLELRDLRVKLQQALESYYAAMGARSNAGIEHLLDVMEQTDLRLAHLDNEILQEVARFEQTAVEISARYSTVHLPGDRMHVCADADDALIELELYRDGWVRIMDDQTRSRLEHADFVLRSIVEQPAAASSPSLLAPPAHFLADIASGSTSHRHSNSMQEDDGVRTPRPYLRQPSPGHDDLESFHMDTADSSGSFATYDALLRSRQAVEGGRMPYIATIDADERTLHEQGARWSRFEQNGGSSTRQVYGHSRLRTSPKDCRDADATARLSFSQNSGAASSPEDRRAPTVISRSRTLRDVAEKAMAQKESQTRPAEAFEEQWSIGHDGVHQAVSNSARPSDGSWHSAQDYASRHGAMTPAEPDQPSIAHSKQASFASTLYNTAHVRVGSISDAGVFLRRSNVKGDGRCLFRALVRARGFAKERRIESERLERESADRLRERAVQELIKHEALLKRFFVIEGNFTHYVTDMAQPRTYGGEPELLMAAKLLHVPIAVYIAKSGGYRQIQVYGKQYRGDPLRILYSDGIHYDALLEWSS